MKKLVILFVLIIIFSIIGSIIADKGSDEESSRLVDSRSKKSGSLIGSSESENSVNSQDFDSTSDKKEKSEIKLEDEESDIIVKKKIKIGKSDDEKNKIKIEERKKIIDENGNLREIKLKIEIAEKDGEVERKLKIESKNKEIEVNTKLEIKEEFKNNITTIKVKLSTGNESELKVLPDKALEIIKEKLETRNFTVELKEVKHKNIPKVVYHIKANKTGRFLGIFKMIQKIESNIDAETGNIIDVNVPWWAFLFIEDKEEDVPSNETSNETINETDLLPIQNDTQNFSTTNLTIDNSTIENQTINNI